jgi:hypothetical protein
MQKEQAPNPPVTRTDIFGDDTSDEDEVEHDREQSGTDGKKKRFI